MHFALGRIAPIFALIYLAFGVSAWPQALPQAPAPQPSLGVQEQGSPPQAAPSPEPAPLPESPGLINEMGKLFKQIVPPLKSPGEAIDDLNARAKDTMKDAGDALSRLKPGAMIKGRMACPATAGTPDCKFGADKLCQSKGYKEGKSLGTDSAETCSAKVLIPGRQRKPDDCRTDTFVTTALCQ
ncbi:MAG TPA: hypothetical protein VGH70_17665 [Bradyrhizobium sp.]|jgi:hypothetical protein